MAGSKAMFQNKTSPGICEEMPVAGNGADSYLREQHGRQSMQMRGSRHRNMTW